MTVFTYEMKKLLSSISLWVLLGIFFIFNLLLINDTRWNPYPEFVGEAAIMTGIRLDASFNERVENLFVDADEQEMLVSLKEDTANVVDHFDDYDITAVGEAYTDYLDEENPAEVPKNVSETIREKYIDMQEVVDQKSEEDEALSLAHASATNEMHENLFGTILGWLILEGVLLSVLIALLSAGYEKGNETESMVYTTKMGRNVILKKLGAALIVGLSMYLFLTLMTLFIYFTVHDYSAIWQSYVSNIFNYRNDYILGARPFVTWKSHTILTYLLSKIGLSLLLLFSFILLTFVVEMMIRNSYISFFVLLILNTTLIVLPLVTSNSTFNFYITLTPIWLWLKHGLWFTDGDIDTLWKHFEWMGVFYSILLLSLSAWLVHVRFKRRDIL